MSCSLIATSLLVSVFSNTGQSNKETGASGRNQVNAGFGSTWRTGLRRTGCGARGVGLRVLHRDLLPYTHRRPSSHKPHHHHRKEEEEEEEDLKIIARDLV